MADGKEKRLLGREIRTTELAGKQALAKINVDIFGATQKQADSAAKAAFERDAAAVAAALQQASTERTAEIYRTPGAGGGGASGTAGVREQRMGLQAQVTVQKALLADARKSFGPTRAADIAAITARMRALDGKIAALGPEESQTPGPQFGEMKVR
jgi:Tfp pilus assembly protein FimV